MKPYEYIDKFTIKYCDVNFKDEMKVSTALALMEEVACASADELGFGQAYIRPRGYAFFVSNIYLECLNPIPLGETVLVKTWPSVPSHVVFGREYQFESECGQPLINATSRWCLLDRNTGKLLQSKAVDNQNYATYNTRKLFEDLKWKIPVFPLEKGEFRFMLMIANSEYDHNMHVNNTRYAEYCFNCFSVDELSKKKLKSFQISYVKQCKEGDVLRFYRQNVEKEEYFIQGYNQKEELVIQSRMMFEE